MDDPRLTDCPSCGESDLFRKISAVAFRLKGSGWYETDFKSENKRQLHDDGKSSSENSGDTTSASSEKNDSNKSSNDSGKSSSESGKESTKTTKAPTSEAA